MLSIFMKINVERKILITLFICIILILILFVINHTHNNYIYEKNIRECENKLRVKMFQSSYQFSCNVYIVSSDRENILIDFGHYDEEIKEYIDEIRCNTFNTWTLG